MKTTEILKSVSTVDLSKYREIFVEYFSTIRDKEGVFGSYRIAPGQRADLYSSVDVALSLAIMGEDLKTRFSAEEREEWCRHLNSFADNDFNSPTDGSYFDRLGHSKLHANGQVLKALGLLGGKLRFPCKLYEPFDSVDKLPGFLDSLRWERCWPQSHQIWGGAFAFSRSAKCTEAWRECLFSWLDANADPQSGWWKKGVPHADRHQGLGGAAHILPIYQHLGRPLPEPERLLDSTLSMQLPSGRWLQTSDPNPMHYLELDALYVYAFAGSQIPDYRRGEILSSTRRFGEVAKEYLENRLNETLALHPHYILAAIGCLGLLHQILPDEWRDDRPWTDIFSDSRFMRTSEVEVF